MSTTADEDIHVLDKDGGVKTSELQRLMREHVGTITTLVTPRVAVKLLETNTRNRKFSPRRAQHFADVIRQGRWINTREPVIIAKNQTMTEGQHRLSGLVTAGRAVEMDICFGAPDDAFWVTGTGATRSGADALSIVGVGRSTQTAAAARMVLWYEAGLPKSYTEHAKLSNDELVLALARWPDLEQAVEFLRSSIKDPKLRTAAAGAFVFLARRQQGQNNGSVGKFLELLRTGIVKTEDSPVWRLRERLINDPSLAANKPPDQIRKLALMIKAWNLWLDNATCARLVWPAGRAASELFPVMANVNLGRTETKKTGEPVYAVRRKQPTVRPPARGALSGAAREGSGAVA